MPITNSVSFVLALLGFLILYVNAQQSSTLIFELDTPGAFNSYPIRGNSSLFPNAPGETVISITSLIPFEICITEGFILEPPYSGCDTNFYLNSSSNMGPSYSSLDSFDSDSSFGIQDDYYETSGSLSSFSEKVSSNYAMAVYLRNGSNYFVNVHSLSQTFNNSKIVVYSYWGINNCPPYTAANPNKNCDVFAPILQTGPNNAGSAANIVTNNEYSESLNYGTFQYVVAPNTAYLMLNYSYTNQTAGLTSSITARLRRGSSPWINNGTYDAMLTSTVNYTTVGFANGYLGQIVTPLPGIWYISVFLPFEQSALLLLVSSKVCYNGTAGANCTTTVQGVNSTAVQVTGSGDYQYFTSTTSNLIVGTGIKNLKTYAPAILASSLGWPSNDSYQIIAQNNTAGSVNVINVANFDYAPVPATSNWYVAVWAPSGYKYYIWSSNICCNNCSDPNNKKPSNKTMGVCQPNGHCTCPKHYGGLWCYHTGLAVIWIVLIVIACAIVLAIAIGVPVALYLRNRGKARYERV